MDEPSPVVVDSGEVEFELLGQGESADFPITFEEVGERPIVGYSSNDRRIEAEAHDITETGFTLRLTNTSTRERTGTATWSISTMPDIPEGEANGIQ